VSNANPWRRPDRALMATTRYTAFSTYGRMLRQARSYWSHVAAIFLLDLVTTPLALLKPLPLKIAIDSVVGSKPLPGFLEVLLPFWLTRSPFRLLFLAAVLQVLIVVVSQLQSLWSYLLSTKTGEMLTLDFRAQLFRHLQRLSLSFHDRRGTADSIYRVEYDAPSIQSIAIHLVIPLISNLVMFMAMIYVVLRIDWQLSLVALTVSPFLLLASHAYDSRMGSKYEAVKEQESRALGVVQEVLTSVRVVKAFGREDNEQERFLRHSSEGVRTRVRLAFAEGIFGLLVNSATAIGTALVLFLGVRSVLSGALTVGSLYMVIAYLAELYAPLQSISGQIATAHSSLVSCKRAFEILDERPDVAEHPKARALKHAAGQFEFSDVSFSYDGENTVLEKVSFKVPAGARVGVAGRTGAGKTTLMSLLIRFYDPTSGRILLDGVDLRDYKLVDLRNQFALVLQEAVLFSTSIAENIAYGRPSSTEGEIIEAAKAANAHDFIVELPGGYNTQVGERGMLLSGGERQRISLARAFLKDAPILILDEPTSAVDVKTEAAIIEAIERLMRGRTSFLISHRLSALQNCNMLLLMENGRIDRITAQVPAALEYAFGANGTMQSSAEVGAMLEDIEESL
jgi:ATP-binding cassette, subfamily B, bacterial